MSNRKISQQAREQILAQLALGRTQAEVASWAKGALGVEITRQAISKLARSTRVERAETTRAVIREAVAPKVASDLEILDREIRRLRSLATKAFRAARADPLMARPFLDVDRALRDAIAQRAKLAGADEPEAPFAMDLASLLGPHL